MCDFEICLKILSIFPGIQPQVFLRLQQNPHVPVKLVGPSSLWQHMAQVTRRLAPQAAPVPEPSVCLGLSPPEQLLSSPHTWAGDPCAAEECAASSTRGPLGSGLVHLMLQEGPHSTNYYLPCSCTCPAQYHWTINISLSAKSLESE